MQVNSAATEKNKEISKIEVKKDSNEKAIEGASGLENESGLVLSGGEEKSQSKRGRKPSAPFEGSKIQLPTKGNEVFFEEFEKLSKIAPKVKIEDYLSSLLKDLSKEAYAKALEDATPLEYKLHAALEDPKKREQLLKLIESK